MRIQVMQSGKVQVFRFFERFTYFILVIASVFHFGQSSSPDSPSVLIHEKNALTEHNEIQQSAASKNNNSSEITVVTGQEHIYIADGASFYGLNEKSVNKITKRKAPSPQPEKSIAKKEPARQKTIAGKPLVHTQLVTSLQERNSQHYISFSAQGACTAPGSSAHHFILYSNNGYTVREKPDDYIIQNYHYIFSAYSKTDRNGGGIRPPPLRV